MRFFQALFSGKMEALLAHFVNLNEMKDYSPKQKKVTDLLAQRKVWPQAQ
jgi:hypothetical protein